MTEELVLLARAPPRSRALSRHPWRAPGLLIPLAVVVLLIAATIAPQWFTSLSPDAVDINAILQPPSPGHWFGTDELGRDVYCRVVYGTSKSLMIGIGAMAIGCLGGISLGTAAGLAPAPVRAVLTRLIDILLAFPELLLALLVIVVLGRGLVNTLLAVGLAHIAGYARLVRSQVLQAKLSGYVEHAVTLGEGSWTIVIGHIVPNTIRPMMVLATIGVGTSVLAASGLSFLGLGVVPPEAEWGALLADGRNYLDIAPWTSLMPATVIALSVIAITLLGRRLQVLLTRGDTP